MSEEYSVEIVNPEKSFLSKDDVGAWRGPELQ